MKANRLANFGTLALLGLLWGSSFILIKKGLIVFSPLQVGSIRMILAALTLIILCFPYLFKFSKKDFKWLLLVGFVGSGFPSVLYPLAQTHLDSAVTGTLNALTPLFTFFIGLIVFKNAFNTLKFGGVLIGLAGAMVVVLLGNIESIIDIDYQYVGYILLATICYATSINVVKKKLQHVSSITISVFSLAVIMPIFIAILAFTGFFSQMDFGNTIYLYSFSALAILAVIGTAVCNLMFFKLTQDTSALFVASVTYIIPIVALCWGFWDGEILQWSHFLGLSLILAGVYLVGKKQA